MKCRICGRKAKKNSIVCSDECQDIRLKMRELDKKYFPTNGCDKCGESLYQKPCEHKKTLKRLRRVLPGHCEECGLYLDSQLFAKGKDKCEKPEKLEHSFTDFYDVLDNRELIIMIIDQLNKE